MDKLQSMRVFAKIVEQGSFHRAGTILHISAAAITRHLSDLEQSLGVRLLNRSTRSLSLTEAGQAYHGHVLHILSSVLHAESVATSMASDPQGKLRLYCHQSFGKFRMPELLSEYNRLHPETTMDIFLSDRDVNIVEEGFDVGIYSGLQKFNDSLVGRQLAASEVVLCASPGYLKKYGTPQEPADLQQHACLSLTFDQLDKRWPLIGEEHEHLIPISCKIASNNLDLLKHYARDGAGIVLSPSYALDEDFQSGRLVRVLPQFHVRKLPLILVYPNRQLLSASVRSFVDFMTQAFPFPEQDPWWGNVLARETV